MKVYFFALVMLFAVSCCASADTIYLTTGLVYRNVNADTTGDVVLINILARVDTVQKSSILLIEYTPSTFEKPYAMMMTDAEKNFIERQHPGSISLSADTAFIRAAMVKQHAIRVDEYSRDHKALIPALILIVFAAEEFDRAAGYTNEMNLRSINDSPDSGGGIRYYKQQRTQAYVIGSVAAIIGAAVTIHALLPVSVSVHPDGVSVAYNF